MTFLVLCGTAILIAVLSGILQVGIFMLTSNFFRTLAILPFLSVLIGLLIGLRLWWFGISRLRAGRWLNPTG